jgi:hypothetical protein
LVPFGAFHDRGPITQRQVAFLLRDFDIAPVVLHPTQRKTQSPRGYKRGQFADAFARYLPKRK